MAHRISVVVLVLTCICTISAAQVSVVATSGSFAGSFYELRTTVDEISWHDANSECAISGGHLVTIGSPEENQFLAELEIQATNLGTVCPPASLIWIGFTDEVIEGTFVWVTGEPVVYTNWATSPQEPNNIGNEDHAHLYCPGDPRFTFWNDTKVRGQLPPGGLRGFFCEYPNGLDHFKCYKAEGAAVNMLVDLEDQLGTEPGVLVGEPVLFCNPVDKNGEGIQDPTPHLICYEIEISGDDDDDSDTDSDDEDEDFDVLIANQFGDQIVTVDEAELLCVPSEKID